MLPEGHPVRNDQPKHLGASGPLFNFSFVSVSLFLLKWCIRNAFTLFARFEREHLLAEKQPLEVSEGKQQSPSQVNGFLSQDLAHVPGSLTTESFRIAFLHRRLPNSVVREYKDNEQIFMTDYPLCIRKNSFYQDLVNMIKHNYTRTGQKMVWYWNMTHFLNRQILMVGDSYTRVSGFYSSAKN